MPGKHTNEKLLSPLALGVFMLHVSREHEADTGQHPFVYPSTSHIFTSSDLPSNF